MTEFTPPLIQPSTPETSPNPSFPPTTSYTRITYTPDLPALNINSPKIPPGDYVAMCRRVVDIAGTTKFKEVVLNGVKIDVPNFQNYSSMYSSPPPLPHKVNARWGVSVSPPPKGGGGGGGKGVKIKVPDVQNYPPLVSPPPPSTTR